MPDRGRVGAAGVLGVVALVLGACTKVDVQTSATTSTLSSTSATQTATGPVNPVTGPQSPSAPTPTPTPTSTPIPGGVLRLVGGDAPDVLDFTTSSPATQSLLHGLSRQLVSYLPGSQFTDVVGRVVADVAVEVPLPVNGTTYTFTIRDGVAWGLTPARPVTSRDFARGIKRLCNPVAGSVYATYFIDTIAGLAGFCSGFNSLTPRATAADMSSYLEKHDVSGLTTPDDRTLVVTLAAPAADFLNMMALAAASAVPVESLAYLPGSAAFGTHLVSDGPYAVASSVAGTSMTLVRNPAWVALSDPIRKAYVDEVDIALGRTEATAAAEIAAGSADFATDVPTPVATVEARRGDPLIDGVTDGASTYLVLNAARPALQKSAVRQALNVAIDKAAVVLASGGPSVAQPLNTILTPQILGFRPTSRHATAGNAGDSAAASRLIAGAGFPKGLALRVAYIDTDRNVQIAQVIQHSWKAAGVSVTLIPVDSSAFQALLGNRSRRAPAWDVALTRWQPSWYGDAARTFFATLIRTGASGNYGRYSNPSVDSLIAQAMTEPDANRAADIWAQADEAAMADPPWVPLFTGRTSFIRSPRVQGWAWNGLGFGDYTRVWLLAR